MGKHQKPKEKKEIVLSILRILFFIAFILSSSYIIKWYIDNRENEKIEKNISEAIILDNEEGVSNEYKIKFEKLKEINNQVMAWLKVKGTHIEYPVVQTDNNKYYLKRNLNKEYNVAGWIFLDYKNKLDGTEKNIVIYGHNMRNDSMFGTLEKILEEDWYNNQENYIVDFITEKEHQKYQVFSVYEIEKENYYINTEFNNNEFKEFIETLKRRSIKDFGVEITEEDSILTLSTCADNKKYRVVLHAKKISE